MYSPIVLDHFHHPRHVGVVSAATGHARLENPVCGDVVEFWTRVVEDRLEEVGFRAFGCAAAIASASMLAELVRGLSSREVLTLEAADLVEALGGLPPSKTHGAALAVETLRAALGEGVIS
jgi:nitrogen fixation NifU-like protein